MLTVERMTAGALARGGIEGGRLWLLLRDVARGRQRSRRHLERIARGELDVVLPRDPSPCPAQYLDRERREGGILVGNVQLGPDLRWEDDTLYGDFPQVIREAAVGRALGDVLSHPHVDATLTTKPPRQPGGLVSVERSVLNPELPTVGERLGHLAYRWRLLVGEGMVDGPVPARFLPQVRLMALAMVVVAALTASMAAEGRISWAVEAVMLLAAVSSVHTAWAAGRPRRFSLLHAMLAESRHQAEMEGIRNERKNGRAGRAT